MRRILLVGGALVLLAAIATVGGVFDGGQPTDSQHPEPADECAGHEHGEAGHGEEAPLAMTLAEIAAARCEHGVAAYQCDNCRYEVGIVKVAPSLREGSPAAGGGLVGTEVVTRRPVVAGLDVTGEIRLNENAAVHISPRIPGII